MQTCPVRNMLALLCLGTALTSAAPASAQSVEQFYKGKSITVLVGTAPGGINDLTARFAAKHLTRFIPGNPDIVVQNTPGGGGLVTANRIFNTSERDGTVLAKLERATPQLAIQGNPQVKFDPMKFIWLGSMSSYADDAYLLLVMADNPAKTIDDIKQGAQHYLTLGANNAASSNLIFGQIARDALKLNVNVVRGYTGAAPLFLAMQRKEIDGQMVGLSSILAGQRDLWSKKAFRPLAQFGRKTRLSEFPDIPTGRELTKDAAVLSLLDFAEAPFFMSLPFVAPPGIPEDRAKALQAAFMQMCRDPAVIAEARKLGFEVSPIDAAEIVTILKQMYATPRDIVARYAAISTDKSIKTKK